MGRSLRITSLHKLQDVRLTQTLALKVAQDKAPVGNYMAQTGGPCATRSVVGEIKLVSASDAAWGPGGQIWCRMGEREMGEERFRPTKLCASMGCGRAQRSLSARIRLGERTPRPNRWMMPEGTTNGLPWGHWALISCWVFPRTNLT